MKVQAIRTRAIKVHGCTLTQLLDKYLSHFEDRSVLALSSKIVSLCEGRVMEVESADKTALIKQEADLYLDETASKYEIAFTIAKNTLIPSAGIDESNGNGHYVLWPENPQRSANQVRDYLVKRFGHKNIGVVITDSTCQPLRYGTIGISLAASGFKQLRDYTGRSDLFGRKFALTQANVAFGLAAAAVAVMGEGTESTPMAVISDVSFVEFTGRNPTKEEVSSLAIDPSEDLYAPLLSAVNWKKNQK